MPLCGYTAQTALSGKYLPGFACFRSISLVNASNNLMRDEILSTQSRKISNHTRQDNIALNINVERGLDDEFCFLIILVSTQYRIMLDILHLIVFSIMGMDLIFLLSIVESTDLMNSLTTFSLSLVPTLE